MTANWTREQVANAMTYGVCWRCGSPRESRQETDRDGNVRVGLVCPNCPDLFDGPHFHGGS